MMTILSLTPPKGFCLPVEGIIAWILDAFPGSRVIHENSFEAERERYRSHYKRLKEKGDVSAELSLGFDLIYRSSLGREQRSGPGKDILVSAVGSRAFHGNVMASSATFYTDLPLEDDAVQRLGGFLKSLHLGKPSIYTENDDFVANHISRS